MTGLAASLWAEWLKSRRSKAPWLMALGLSMAPLAMGLFMVIIKDPDWARQQGLISAKAQITGASADWPTYFGFLAQAIAVGGFVVFGLVAIWVFGREYSDRTAKDLLALPTSREAIVSAKVVVASCWSAAIAVVVYLIGLGLGGAIGLAGWSPDLPWRAAGQIATVAGLTILVVTPLAWLASAGRGDLPPVGAMFFLLALAQILAALGWGSYFPWAIPAIAGGAMGPDEARLGVVSYAIVALTSLAGFALTLGVWRYADQS